MYLIANSFIFRVVSVNVILPWSMMTNAFFVDTVQFLEPQRTTWIPFVQIRERIINKLILRANLDVIHYSTVNEPLFQFGKKFHVIDMNTYVSIFSSRNLNARRIFTALRYQHICFCKIYSGSFCTFATHNVKIDSTLYWFASFKRYLHTPTNTKLFSRDL